MECHVNKSTYFLFGQLYFTGTPEVFPSAVGLQVDYRQGLLNRLRS